VRRGTQPGLDEALELVGDRWTLQLVEELGAGTARFGELAERLGVATNVLADRLRRLERAGLVVAVPYQRRPLRVAYELTQEGQSLGGVVSQLAAWGAERAGRAAGRRRHDVCGTDLEVRLWCPTCERSVESHPDAEAAPEDLIWV